MRLALQLVISGQNQIGATSKKVVVLAAAHHKVAYPLPPPLQLWSNYHFLWEFFLLRIP